MPNNSVDVDNSGLGHYYHLIYGPYFALGHNSESWQVIRIIISKPITVNNNLMETPIHYID